MADQFIQVPVDGAGKRVDTSELTVGGTLVERQRLVIADDSSAGGLAKVSSTDPSIGDTGLVVRHVHGNVSGDPEFVSVTNIPHVVVDTAPTTPVTGTFFQATQPVSLASTVVVKADTAGNQANALKVDGSAVTQPVSGTVVTTPPANASSNVSQLAGTTVDTNSGSKSAGTLRVVLATDQPALTNKLLTTPDNPSNLDVALSTRLKPGDTLTGVTTVGSITNPVTVAQPTGTSLHVVVDSAPTTPVTGTVGISGLNFDEQGNLQINQREVNANLLQILLALSDPTSTLNSNLNLLSKLSLDSSGNLLVNIQSSVPLNFPAIQPVSATDGSIATIGTTADVAAIGDSAGTEISQMRGMNYGIDQLRGDVRQTNALLFLLLDAANRNNLSSTLPSLQ